MTAPRLYLIAPRILFASDAAWLDAIERVAAAAGDSMATLVRASVDVALQVRVEAESGAERLAARARERARRAFPALPLFLNAACSVPGYDGVHWPERRIPASRGDEPVSSRTGQAGAERELADAPRRGASVHSTAALRRAEAAGAGFAVFGPVWSPSWKETAPRGLEALATLTASARIPVLGIGGITPECTGSCLRAGAAGIAVASGVFAADDARAALLAYGGAVVRALEAPG